MKASVSRHAAPACDLSDAHVVDNMVQLRDALRELTPEGLRILRFGASVYEGAGDGHEIANSVFSASPDVRSLHTITEVTLVVGSGDDQIDVRYHRKQGRSAEVEFVPVGAEALAERVREAEKEVERLKKQASQGRTQQQGVQPASKTLKEASRAQAAALPRQVERMLLCVAGAEEVGLLRPSVARSAPTTADGALAEEVGALRATIASLQRDDAERARLLAEEYQQRSGVLAQESDDRFARLKEEYDAREERLRKEHAEKDAELDAKSSALKAREEQLDLSEERAARRKMRQDLQDAAKSLAEKPELSEDAQKSFARVAGMCLSTIVASLLVLVVVVVGPVVLLSMGFSLSEDVAYLAWSLRVLAGAALAAALVYYVRALSERARMVSEIEVRSRQFALDVDRASWLVEMALEYEKNGKSLPPELVSAFSRGLFERSSESESAQPLVQLLEQADALRVGGAGMELEMSGRKLKRAVKASRKEE